ncbi:MAG: substrate-binding domain-containing protein, partial [Candidatus Omnitrophica bacterium]|nr:substrate-binding domain-containing protein [Candidatus Omnitrophota bacterium]
MTVDVEILESILWNNGYHLFIGYTGDDIEKENSLIRDFLSRRVDGIIFVVGNYNGINKEIEKIVGKNFPLITVGRFKDLKTDFISTDYFKGGHKAAEHLYKKGYRKTAVLFWKQDNGNLSLEERKKGFLKFVEEREVEISKYYIEKG